jgi:hypothetical protein
MRRDQEKKDLRFEVYMAVTMKNVVFWDVTMCSSCKNPPFREKCHCIFKVESVS